MSFDLRSRNALFDIRDHVLLARRFVEGLTFETFKQSRLHVYAAMRAVEIISEASRRLPDEVRERYPELPWRAIRDVGNFYRHEYDNVAESFLWATVHDHLGPLMEAILREIETLDNP